MCIISFLKGIFSGEAFENNHPVNPLIYFFWTQSIVIEKFSEELYTFITAALILRPRKPKQLLMANGKVHALLSNLSGKEDWI